jgi:hypothetical protein
MTACSGAGRLIPTLSGWVGFILLVYNLCTLYGRRSAVF